VKEREGSDTSSVKPVGKISSGLAKQIVRMLRAELTVSKWRLACPAWSFRALSCCLKVL
jgi:hypothetical protein